MNKDGPVEIELRKRRLRGLIELCKIMRGFVGMVRKDLFTSAVHEVNGQYEGDIDLT